MSVSANRMETFVAVVDRRPYAAYTVFFLIMFAAFWFGYAVDGKSFIWYIDGFEQQYMYFILEGEWLRSLLAAVFSGGSVALPMWSDSIGYGADYYTVVINTLGNPINLLSVFVTAENADLMLNATVPLTLYLAGVSFIGYCRYKEHDAFASLAGCMVYVFSGYSYLAFTQIYMLYPLILGPLIIWGIDKVFDRQSGLLFVVAMSLCFLYSVSTGYVVCLLLLVYCSIKYLQLEEEKSIKGFLTWFFKIFGMILLSILVAGVTFYPTAASILSQDRLGLDRDTSLLYPALQYIEYYLGFISPSSVGADCYYGFAPLALISVFGLFVSGGRIKGSKQLILLFLLLSVFLCLPLAGRVFNGFAYPNNRWVWAYCLLIGAVVVRSVPVLLDLSAGEKRNVTICCLAYALISIVFLASFASETYYGMLCVLFITLAIILASESFSGAAVKSMLALTLVAGCFFVSIQWAERGANSQVGLGRAYLNAVTKDPSYVLSLVDDDAIRYDSADLRAWRNGNFATGLQGSTFYNSFYSDAIDDYHSSLGLVTSPWNFSYTTFDSRTAMELLAGNEYFIVPSTADSGLPPLFEEKVAEAEIDGSSVSAYRANLVLPLAYFCDSTFSSDEFDSLTMVERQEALLQGVVVEDALEGRSAVFEDRSITVPYSLVTKTELGEELLAVDERYYDQQEDAIFVENGRVVVNEANSVLYLECDIPAGTESYLTVTDLSFEPSSPDEVIGTDAWNSMNIVQKKDTIVSSLFYTEPTESYLYVFADDTVGEIRQMNSRNHLYGGKDDWAVNLGYSDQARHVVAIQFRSAGVYTFDGLEIEAEDVFGVLEDAAKLASEGSLESLVFESNTIKCEGFSESSQYLCFRVPYSEGWRAEVNGEATDIVKANVGFMAVPVSEGLVSVELRYETSNLSFGVYMSALGLMAIAIWWLSGRIRKTASACNKD